MAEREATWTLEELAARVALALSVDYDGQPSGRVREVPDGRVVRYYTTLGLIDRPVRYEAKVAIYTKRHLFQIVGIKRLQQKGHSLSEIQQMFVRLDERALERLAAVPAEALSPAMESPTPAPRAQAEDAKPVRPEVEKVEAPKKEAPARERFWNAAPADAVTDAVVTSGVRRTAQAPSAVLTGVPISPEAVLLAGFARELDDADLEAIRAAAAPLLKVLEKRGLL